MRYITQAVVFTCKSLASE